MTEKIVISKPGFNVLTETDPNNIIFSSDFNTLKYYASGTVTVNWVDDGTVYTVQVVHNLGYIPFFIAFVREGGSTTLYNVVPNDQTTIAGRNYQNVYADATKLYFAVQKGTGSGLPGSTIFVYKLFKNNTGL